MPRILRENEPGSWHHVFNRGIARRALFDSSADRRLFLSLLALQVRRGRIRVHAFSLLSNHFHLLVETPKGELDLAMRDLCREYSKRFNRARGRDGPLFRSRFGSKPAASEVYRRNVLVYVDRNAVAAKVVALAEEHEWGSAHHFDKGRDLCPAWLATDWVERVAASRVGIDGLPPGIYRHVMRTPEESDLAELVGESKLGRALRDPYEDERLTQDTSAWLQERALAADGREDWLPIASSSAVSTHLRRRREWRGQWRLGPRVGPQDLWPIAEAGLITDLVGLSLALTAARLGCSTVAARRRRRKHWQLIQSSAAYREEVADIVCAITRSSMVLLSPATGYELSSGRKLPSRGG